MSHHVQCDVAIIGSSFSGCLLAWILAQHGRHVVVVDRARHPRFAIGESSTPLADFLLEQIADEFGLESLKPLSRWGSWQRELGHLRAGKKRGFSYFAHRAGEPFLESHRHEASLLVAASATDAVSDTHWMRSDVDHWLCQQAIAAGAMVIEQWQSAELSGSDGEWLLHGSVQGEPRQVGCRQVIEASGSGAVIARAVPLMRLDETLRVRTGALFGHFQGVGKMTDWMAEHRLPTAGDPFDADDAAQHHCLAEGWMWMLRFSEGTTSAGLVRPTIDWMRERPDPHSEGTEAAWARVLQRYPTLASLFREATLAPTPDGETPQLRFTPRISRLWDRAAGAGWAMLPTSAGIVDPLHSTGIAHALSGVQRVARILLESPTKSSRDWTVREAWQRYSQSVVAEVQWIDRIVAACYRAKEDSFELFTAACSLYFLGAIHCERHLAEAGELQEGFLLHDSTEFQRVLVWMEKALEAVLQEQNRQQARSRLIVDFRKRLSDWNDVGLLDPALHHRIARSSAPK